MHSLNLLSGIATLCVCLTALPCMVYAIPLHWFYRYGRSAGDAMLRRNDDGVSPPIPLGSSGFRYYRNLHSSIFVNNNGPISFDGGMPGYTPEPFPVSGSPPFLAAYWADVDTRPSNGGAVYYRASTEPDLLQWASNHISWSFILGRRRFRATWLFIATWERVGYYQRRTDRTNTFQVVLITDGKCSYVTYLYADGLIQWTTGDASDGEGGLGGTPAQAGFDAGDQRRSFSIDGSLTADIINIDSTTNVGVPGQWTFRVDWIIAQPGDSEFTYACGSDPHFAIRLSEGELLCYTFQGRHNTTFNLLGNDDFQMNALFVPDATDYDNTWLGSIGVAVLRDGKKMTTLQFTAADQLVRIGGRVQFDAKTIKKLSFNKGVLSTLKVPSNHSQRYPRVEVEFIDSKLSFTVGFTKNGHLDLYWHSTGMPLERSTGVVGQFFRDGVKIDVDAQLLHVPGHPPVPVEKRDLWKFVSKNIVGDRQCWTSAYPSSQGAGVVAGTYEDYIVDDLLASGP